MRPLAVKIQAYNPGDGNWINCAQPINGIAIELDIKNAGDVYCVCVLEDGSIVTTHQRSCKVALTSGMKEMLAEVELST